MATCPFTYEFPTNRPDVTSVFVCTLEEFHNGDHVVIAALPGAPPLAEPTPDPEEESP